MQSSSLKTRSFLFFICFVSLSLLLLSFVFLLTSGDRSFLPQSALMRMVINNTRVMRPHRNNDLQDFVNHSSSPSVILPVEKPSLGTKGLTHHAAGESKRESKARQKHCGPDNALLKVYMYDLPPDFHFGLLGWKSKTGRVWPDTSLFSSIPAYPGGLNLQHSVAYWLTLDLLASEMPNVVRPCSAIRVKSSSQADVVFVPFFSSISYNRYSKIHGTEKVSKNKKLQDELVEYLMGREEWKRSAGKDHLIVAHHPNSMLYAREKLGSAMFVLADFGRYPVEIANIDKDIIAPYWHVVKAIGNDSASFEGRPTLVYFQGAIYRKDGGYIRQELYYLLKDEKDVHFTFGTVRGRGTTDAAKGMGSSKFCLNIAGDTPSSNRLFDAIANHCVPVIISDEIELPFEDVLDYSEFCIFVHGSDAVKPRFLLNLLRGIKREEWTRMWKRLKEVAPHFEYNYPSQADDAVDMIWKVVARKIADVQLKHNRENRLHMHHVGNSWVMSPLGSLRVQGSRKWRSP